MGLQKRVLFIRHAESEANAGRPTSEHSSIALTALGAKQGICIVNGIDSRPCLVIVTPFLRTQQTARPLLEKFLDVPVETWPLQEYQFIAQRHCLNTTDAQRRPVVDAYWQRCDPTYINGYGPESFRKFRARIMGSIKALEKRSEHFIVVFAHGHVIRAIRQYFSLGPGLSNDRCMQHYRDEMLPIEIQNASIHPCHYGGSAWQTGDIINRDGFS